VMNIAPMPHSNESSSELPQRLWDLSGANTS